MPCLLWAVAQACLAPRLDSNCLGLRYLTTVNPWIVSASADTYRPLRNLPLQLDMISRKFMSLVSPVLGEARAAKLHETIMRTERLESVRGLMELSSRE